MLQTSNSFSNHKLDFSNCEVVPIVLEGMRDKFVINYQDELYIIKLNKKVNGVAVREHIAEYVTYLLCKALDFPCQEVLLGTYNNEDVCALKYFLFDGELLHQYREISDSSISDSNSREVRELPYDIDIIMSTIDSYKNLCIDKETHKYFFWCMFCIDTIIANFDRHWGNWGVIGTHKNYKRIAPLYDNGSSLFTKFRLKDLNKILNDKNLCISKPTSQIKIGNQRASYADIIIQGLSKGLRPALSWLHSKVKEDTFSNIMSDTVLQKFTTATERDFLLNVMQLRYEILLKNK